MYKLCPISREQLQVFYDAYEGEKTFLQSGRFGAWREDIGEKIHYLGLFDREKLIGTALIQGLKSRFKSYLHCPHGPLISSPDSQESGLCDRWEAFLEAYKTLGKAKKVDLIRIAPLLRTDKGQIYDFFPSQSFRPASLHLINPEHTLSLDLTQSEEEILAQMRKSTRYEVRRIEKCGITVRQGNSKEALEAFWALHVETVKRQKFIPFPLSYTKKQLQHFGDDCLIFNAQIEQKIYSSAIVLFDNQAAYYHQGASTYCKFPCSHAGIWAAIREAKRRGCREFNFWGIVDDELKNHPWYGLSKFKKGFGGTEKKFLHVHDFEYTPKAKLNRLVEKWRKWRRGY